MSFAGAMTTLETILTAAGTATTPTITVIRRGMPPLTPTRCLAYWYEGDGEPIAFAAEETVGGDHMIGEQVSIAAYWPLADFNASLMATLDTAMQSTNRAIQSRIYADRDLGGNCSAATPGDSSVEFIAIDGQAVARLLIPLTLDFEGIEPITA